MSDRISTRMRQLNLKNKHLVEATRATKGTVSQWVNGGNEPSSKYISSLARILQVSEQWLTEGGALDETNNITNQSSLKRRIPLISIYQATNWREMMTNDFDKFTEWVETSEDVSPFSFALKVVGDSMTSFDGGLSIPESSVVIVDPEQEAISGRFVVAKFKDTPQAVIKKFIVDGPNSYLMSLNHNYKPILIDANCEIVGVCVKVQINLI